MTALLTPSRHGLVLPPSRMCLAQVFAALPAKAKGEILAALDVAELEQLQADWRFIARREQLPPEGEWNVWIILAGRGAGKTRTGAEYLAYLHRNRLVGGGRSAIIAPTVSDLWAVCTEGESGLLACAGEDFKPEIHRQARKLTWPDGSLTSLYSAEEPERLRGPQHGVVWLDEFATMGMRQDSTEADSALEYLWNMVQMGLRLGERPEVLITTTPRPRKLIVELLEDAKTGGAAHGRKVAVTGGSTYDNAANLPKEFISALKVAYEGTRIGQQEIYAQVLEILTGGLWKEEEIERNRVKSAPESLRRIVVAIDPPISNTETSDLAGIIAAGLGEDSHAYVLGDYSLRGGPEMWAKKAVAVFHYLKADLIVAEKNQGGDMVEHTIRTVDPSVPVKMVWSSRGKVIRAEPVAMRYEKNQVHHVGRFAELEEQMLRMGVGRVKKSPDRCDSLVFAITELLPATKGRAGFFGRVLK